MGYPVALPDPITPATKTFLGLAGLATTGITGDLTLTKTGTTARTATFPDATIEVQSSPEVINASWTARNHAEYTVIATGTATDPTPVNGHYFGAIVHAGTATIGGVAYSTPGARVIRLRHAGTWNNYVYPHLDAAWTWTAAQSFRANGSHFFGVVAATGLTNVVADGGNSGINAGSSYFCRGNGSTTAAFGNFSSILGGAYDARTMVYSASTDLLFNIGATTAFSVSAAGVVSALVNIASTSTTTGSLLSAGGLGVAGQMTTAQIAVTATTDSGTGTINALANPTGFIRLTGAAPDVRGIANPGASACRRVVLYCVNATTLTHEAGTATAADRITSDTGANIAVAAGKTVELIYDTVSSRWRPVRF